MTTAERNDPFMWTYLLRQLLVASGVWVIFFSMGIVYGAPTVYIPQIRKTANTTGQLTDDMASWLSSAVCYAAIPWIFVLNYMARAIGRRRTSMFVAASNISAFVLFACSSTPIYLLITKVVFGVSQASIVSVFIVVVTEYTSPKYRGVFLCIKSATGLWGVWVANAIGTYAHWWYIPLTGLIVSLYAVTIIFWPESPYWLASKKRFNECRTAHRWLKGSGEFAEYELDLLIKSQICEDVASTSMIEAVKLKEFYMPLFLSVLVTLQYHLSGKFVITIYAIDILKRIISDESKVYRSMLILDGVTVFSTYAGCYFIKLCKRRTILFTSTSIAILFLFILSIYMYLIKYSVITENVYVSIFFLSGFSLSISCGPMILSSSLYGELIPSRFKSITFTLVALIANVIHGVLLKVSPLIFKGFGIEGAFLTYGIGSSICLLLLFIYLPETKDKTLLEIEEYFKCNKTKDESKKLVGM